MQVVDECPVIGLDEEIEPLGYVVYCMANKAYLTKSVQGVGYCLMYFADASQASAFMPPRVSVKRTNTKPSPIVKAVTFEEARSIAKKGSMKKGQPASGLLVVNGCHQFVHYVR